MFANKFVHAISVEQIDPLCDKYSTMVTQQPKLLDSDYDSMSDPM